MRTPRQMGQLLLPEMPCLCTLKSGHLVNQDTFCSAKVVWIREVPLYMYIVNLKARQSTVVTCAALNEIIIIQLTVHAIPFMVVLSFCAICATRTCTCMHMYMCIKLPFALPCVVTCTRIYTRTYTHDFPCTCNSSTSYIYIYICT